MHDRRSFLLAGGTAVAASLIPDTLQGADANDEAAALIKEHVAKLQPLEIAGGIAWWNANITGKDDDFKKKEEAQNKIDAALSDNKMFGRVKALKASADKGEIKDAVVARQVQLLYLQYLEKQVKPELLQKITSKANAVEQTFNVFRAKVDGEEIADSKVRSTLKDSADSALRQKVWEASKVVGAKVEADLAELVTLRNEAATQLGFKNFHELQLALNEQDGAELIKLFDDLDKLTNQPFTTAKKEIDERLAKKLGVKVADLMPWHYHDPFFQESPAVFDAN
ncbi:MAG: M2 family metallopeptidase, partial [Gemmataceae bacterium]|nr:M2 family metallopeptidase [Gemmataceae bacterium]